MNCKEGDLAIVVKSKNGKNLGKIVRCISYIGTVEEFKQKDIWLVDQMQIWTYISTGEFVEYPFASDSNLRPLRDDIPDDAEDEMVKIVGLPKPKYDVLEA